MLEAQHACKNHGNTSTRSHSTDKAAPHLDPKDLAGLDLVWDSVDDLENQAMDGILAPVRMLGTHLPQVLGTQVHHVVGGKHAQGAQLNQALWATMKAGRQV